MTAIEGPCDCTGPHFHSVIHDCCSRLAEVESAYAELTENAGKLFHQSIEHFNRAKMAEARALFRQRQGMCDFGYHHVVRAAARGEGDLGMRYDPDAALDQAIADIDALRARLAAIEKLCEDGTIRDNWTATQVLAAARGEGNRG